MARLDLAGAIGAALSGCALGAPIVQDFETFALGSSAQDGWSDTTLSSIVSSGIAGFGDRSLQLSGSAIFSAGSVSPTLVSPVYGIFAFDVVMGEGGGFMQTANTGAGLINGRMFFTGGEILVLNASSSFDVIGSYTEGQVFRVGIELVDAVTDFMNYYLDGVLVDTGNAFGQGGLNRASFGLWNGDLEGGDPAAGMMTIDNINGDLTTGGVVVIPLPTPMALASAGLVGALGLRRRR